MIVEEPSSSNTTLRPFIWLKNSWSAFSVPLNVIATPLFNTGDEYTLAHNIAVVLLPLLELLQRQKSIEPKSCEKFKIERSGEAKEAIRRYDIGIFPQTSFCIILHHSSKEPL